MAQAMLDFHEFSLMSQNQSIPEQEQKDMETLLSTSTEGTESQQDQNFSQDDNDVPPKKGKRNSTKNYSNTKVKMRNLLANVSYRRFTQSDFNTTSFIVDILALIVQNFNPISLDRNLDNEKEKEMLKFIWEECIPNVFISFMYSKENYDVISDPKLTYQKANKIVEKVIMKNPNYINMLKYKIEEKFHFIHCVYSLLYPKIYNRTVSFGIQKKSNFDFSFQNWRLRKNNGPIGQKIIEELAAPTKQLLIPDVLSKEKSPREANENEQVPINIKQKSPLSYFTKNSSSKERFRF